MSAGDGLKRSGSSEGLPQVSVLPPKRFRSKPGTSIAPIPRRDKPAGKLLTEQERKANHIASEKKRRQAIREAFDNITEIVPTLTEAEKRREAVVLEETAKFLKELIEENRRLKTIAARHNLTLPEGCR
jgi:heteromeric Ino2p/Ino4p transcription factor